MNKTIIIAEAGVNHNGDIELAKELIDMAVDAKADVVKFQSFKADELCSKSAPKVQYQTKNTDSESSQYQMLKDLELSYEDCVNLKKYADEHGIVFLSTPFSESVADEICDMIPFWKIASGEIINLPFLKHLAKFKKPMVLSTGMSELNEIENAVEAIRDEWRDSEPESIKICNKPLAPLTILQCVSSYPAKPESSNLKAMNSMKKQFNTEVGYSDHTLGMEVSIAAVALGASIIEKHITLDKNMKGPDHKASMEPEDFKTMAEAIRNVEKALGDGIKKPHNSELSAKVGVRKSIHIAHYLKKGSKIELENIVMKRPGNGIEPFRLNQILGKRVKNDVDKDYQLKWEDVE